MVGVEPLVRRPADALLAGSQVRFAIMRLGEASPLPQPRQQTQQREQAMSEETPGEPGAADTEPVTTAGEGADSTPSGAKRTTVEVPKWAALVLAALVLLGVGFAIGWVAAPGGGHHHRGEFPEGGRLPGGPGSGGLPGGSGGSGGSSGRTLPLPARPSTPSTGVFLGVATQDATGSSGAQVVNVVGGSPADQAGLKAGDIVTAVDGSPVTSAAQLATQIRAHQSGDQVTLTYTRNGASAQAQVKLTTRAASTPSA
jgi:membrane-associated protease RseP (regulator of RpoE activity)